MLGGNPEAVRRSPTARRSRRSRGSDMLMRSEPFREFDRLTESMLPERQSRPIPIDAYRRGNEFTVHFDLPGVDSRFVELTVEKDLLTVRATRGWVRAEGDQIQIAERPQGEFSRQLFLGEGLDRDHISAAYANGVLTLTIPVAEEAKPRRVEITHAADVAQPVIAGSVAE
jgi:HSP20 family protein